MSRWKSTAPQTISGATSGIAAGAAGAATGTAGGAGGASLAPETLAPAGQRVSHDPSWLIQRAWSVFRLPRLQELIVASIDELRVEPSPSSPPAGAPSGSPDPAAEALRVCCDEMREASGMPGAEAVRAQHVAVIRRYMKEEPLDWSEAFARALETYRQAAAQTVERAFARARAA